MRELIGVPRGVIWGYEVGGPGGTRPGRGVLGLRKNSKKHEKKWPKKQVATPGSVCYSMVICGISEMVEALGTSKLPERNLDAQTDLGSYGEGEFIGQVKNFLRRAMKWDLRMEFVFVW